LFFELLFWSFPYKEKKLIFTSLNEIYQKIKGFIGKL